MAADRIVRDYDPHQVTLEELWTTALVDVDTTVYADAVVVIDPADNVMLDLSRHGGCRQL